MIKEKRVTRKIFFGMFLGFFAVLLFFGNPSHLFSVQDKPPLSISFSFGYFLPNEDSFKELYGNNNFRLNLNLNYVLLKNVSIFSGLGYLSCEGETKIIEPEFQEEKYRLKFKMYSIPIGIIFSFPAKNVYPFLGGGASYNIYSEEWDQFDVSFEDKKVGVFLIGGMEYFIAKRFSLLAGIQYSSIPTKQGAKLDEKVNLGGIEFSLGFSFHL